MKTHTNTLARMVLVICLAQVFFTSCKSTLDLSSSFVPHKPKQAKAGDKVKRQSVSAKEVFAWATDSLESDETVSDFTETVVASASENCEPQNVKRAIPSHRGMPGRLLQQVAGNKTGAKASLNNKNSTYKVAEPYLHVLVKRPASHHRHDERKMNMLAVASMVCSILGIFVFPVLGSVAAIMLGCAALGQIRRHRDAMKGKGLAITGIILGTLTLLVLFYLVILWMLASGGGLGC